MKIVNHTNTTIGYTTEFYVKSSGARGVDCGDIPADGSKTLNYSDARDISVSLATATPIVYNNLSDKAVVTVASSAGTE